MRSAEIALKYRQDSTLMKKEIFIKEKENQVVVLRQWITVLFLGMLLIISASGFIIIYRKRKIDMKIWGMQADISSLRLESVRNRISPHFIFNVLNREVAKYTDDIDKSNLVNLSKLIRKNLELTGSCPSALPTNWILSVHTYQCRNRIWGTISHTRFRQMAEQTARIYLYRP